MATDLEKSTKGVLFAEQCGSPMTGHCPSDIIVGDFRSFFSLFYSLSVWKRCHTEESSGLLVSSNLREPSLVSNSLKFKESLSDIISVTLWVIETKDKRKQSEIRSLGGSYQMRVTLSNDLWEFWKFNFEFSVDEFHERLMTIRRDGLPIANWFGWVIRRK